MRRGEEQTFLPEFSLDQARKFETGPFVPSRLRLDMQLDQTIEMRRPHYVEIQVALQRLLRSDPICDELVQELIRNLASVGSIPQKRARSVLDVGPLSGKRPQKAHEYRWEFDFFRVWAHALGRGVSGEIEDLRNNDVSGPNILQSHFTAGVCRIDITHVFFGQRSNEFTVNIR